MYCIHTYIHILSDLCSLFAMFLCCDALCRPHCKQGGGGGGSPKRLYKESPNRLYKAPTDNTKPQDTTQSAKETIQRPKTLNKTQRY